MRFQLTALTTLLALAASTLGQNIQIATPADGSSIPSGQNITVEVDRPNSLTGSQEVALVLALRSCNSDGTCAAPSDALGTILYSGAYSPQYAQGAAARLPPHQNFTVAVPGSFKSGEKVTLSATHLALVGAGPFPMFEVKNVTLTIQ